MAEYKSPWSRVPTQIRNQYRARVAATLPGPCTVCNGVVERGDAWDLDHIRPIHLGGPMLDPSNHGPAHASCNRSAGATSGNLARSRNRNRIRNWT